MRDVNRTWKPGDLSSQLLKLSSVQITNTAAYKPKEYFGVQCEMNTYLSVAWYIFFFHFWLPNVTAGETK